MVAVMVLNLEHTMLKKYPSYDIASGLQALFVVIDTEIN